MLGSALMKLFAGLNGTSRLGYDIRQPPIPSLAGGVFFGFFHKGRVRFWDGEIEVL